MAATLTAVVTVQGAAHEMTRTTYSTEWRRCNMLDKVVVLTVRDSQTLACPLCSFTRAVPPVQSTPDALAAVFGMQAATMDQVRADQIVAEAARDMRKHLEDHDVVEWLEHFRA